MLTPWLIVVEFTAPPDSRIGAAIESAQCRSRTINAAEAVEAAERHAPDAIIIRSALDSGLALGCLRRLHASVARIPLLFIAEQSSEELAIAALHSGAMYYLKEPWDSSQLRAGIAALVPQGAGEQVSDAQPLQGGNRLIGHSQSIRELRSYIRQVAPSQSNVLVCGETGTGKELVAELIHSNSTRRAEAFVCLNSAAIPETLIESELFGHERGAFTGAIRHEPGKLAAADRGTIFLDEIGDISLSVQAKLLRVLECKRVHRLGSSHATDLDVRVVTATNHNLEEAVRQNRFRQDLYYRLNVVRIELSPLRERAEDIGALVEFYVRQFNQEFGHRILGLSPRAVEVLRTHAWPGNIRELRNVLEALFVNLTPGTTGRVDLPPQVLRQLARAVSAPVTERDRLMQALIATKWNKSKAASQLQCSRMTLYRKMHQYHVSTGRGN